MISECMTIILATQEVEIGRIEVPSQARHKVWETPSQWEKAGQVVCTCHLSDDRKHKVGSRPRLAKQKSETLSPK
jgi:hypothetical protein